MITGEDSNEENKYLYNEKRFLIREKEPEGISRKHQVLEFANTNVTPLKTPSYGCDQCDFQSVEKGEIINHKNTHHEYDTFNCDQCDFWARYENHIKDHIRYKHNEVNYNCNKCKYEANCQSDILDHNIDNHHWDENKDEHIDGDGVKAFFGIGEAINQSDNKLEYLSHTLNEYCFFTSNGQRLR